MYYLSIHIFGQFIYSPLWSCIYYLFEFQYLCWK